MSSYSDQPSPATESRHNLLHLLHSHATAATSSTSTPSPRHPSGPSQRPQSNSPYSVPRPSTVSNYQQQSAPSGLDGSGEAGRKRDRQSTAGFDGYSDGDGDEDDQQGDGQDGDGNGDGSMIKRKKGRKRNRQALSCVECKRRKIKCDRHTPCEACCKRGEEKLCHWESPKVEVAPQPFALATDHESLLKRVAHLEAILLKGSINPYSLPSHHHHPPQAQIEGGAGGVQRVLTPTTAAATVGSSGMETPGDGRGGLEAEIEEEDATEEAALVLEELALGRKLTRLGPGARKSTSTPSVGYSYASLAFAAGDSRNAPTSASLLSMSSLPSTSPSSAPASQLPAGNGVGAGGGIVESGTISRAMASLLVTPLTGRRRLALDEIWKSIPTSKPMLDWLVSSYFSRTDWSWHIHHRPTFLAEYEAFSALVAAGRKEEVDPLWLASLCMTLCLAVHSLDGKIESPLVNISDDELETLPWEFFEAAQGCLECGDWTGKPRIRTLQAIVLFAPFLLFAGVPAAGERHQTYLGAGIRICQQLGLHKLGSDPTLMPPEDPALPLGVCTLRRELPLRLFSALVFLDYMIVRVTSALPPEKVNTSLPGNFDDNDLSAEGIVSPKPDHVLTDVSFEVIKAKVAALQHKFNEVVMGDAAVEYFTILELDHGYRTIIASLPTELRDDFVAPSSEDTTHSWRRAMAIQTIYNRLLRLHRPFMSPGYRDPKYAFSTTSAIEAARKCLIAQRALQRAPLVKCGFQLLNIQGAVVVLAMGIWTEWSDEPFSDNSDYGLMTESAAFFERYVKWRQPNVRKVAQQGLQTIGLLFDAFDKRRGQSEARRAAGEPWKSDTEESYGNLLKRLGAVVVASAAARGSCVEGVQRIKVQSPEAELVDGSSLGSLPDPFLATDGIDWSANGGNIFTNVSFLDSSAPSFSTDLPATDTFSSADFDFMSLYGPPYALGPEYWGMS